MTMTVEPEASAGTPSATTPRSWAFLAGVIGAAAALSIGELFDNLSDSVTSLVIAVGEVIIDITPGDLIAESINTIGQAQKPLLLGGITIVSLLLGGTIGARGANRPAVVPIGFGAFGILGGAAGARSELTSAGASWAVAVLAAAVGASLTLALLAASRRPVRSSTPGVVVPGSPFSHAADRRRFLAFGGAAVGTAAVYAGSRAGRTTAAERAREQILTESASPGQTADSVVEATNPLPTGAFDEIEGITSYITPITPRDEFYLIDTALQKPQVDPANWSLTIDGEYVTNPVSYSFDQLMARDMVETEVTLSCVSNPVGGDLVGNAVWRGIPLAELFDEAGILDPTDATTQVFSRSVDGFTCGFPTPLAYDGRTAMLALEMNGEPLPISHGFPARLVVAGLYGYVSATKWVERISITDWEGVDGFWMPRGWSKEGPIKTQSRIDVPRSNAAVEAGTVPIAGIAWSPTIGIDRVEVMIGDDDNWLEADLAEVDTDETWRQWRFDWDATPGTWIVRVRATDKSGFTQSPIPVAPAPNGAEGHHSIAVRVI